MAVDVPPSWPSREQGELRQQDDPEGVAVSQGSLLKTGERERRRVLRAMNVKPFLGDERAARHPFLRGDWIGTRDPDPSQQPGFWAEASAFCGGGVHKQLINVRFDDALVPSACSRLKRTTCLDWSVRLSDGTSVLILSSGLKTFMVKKVLLALGDAVIAIADSIQLVKAAPTTWVRAITVEWCKGDTG